MSDSDHREKKKQPFEIEVIVPRQIDLIDPSRGARWIQPAARRIPSLKRKKLAIFLFVATCVSTVFTGALFHSPSTVSYWEMLWIGLSYAVPVMAILLAHEMGHYLMARRYHVPASYPYFIPMPFNPFGTMGAVIVQGAGVANRKQLFDIAVWGPLAGLVFAIPIAIYGVYTCELRDIDPAKAGMAFGDPLILQWMIEIILSPKENESVIMSPIFFAGWVGFFITALNLIPVGQLDGGHILYTLIGKRAHIVAKAILLGTISYVLFSQNYVYVLMIILLLMMGPSHPPTTDDRMPLGWPRIVLGWLTLSFIIIGFTPQPFVDPEIENQQQKTELKIRPEENPDMPDQRLTASSTHVPFHSLSNVIGLEEDIQSIATGN